MINVVVDLDDVVVVSDEIDELVAALEDTATLNAKGASGIEEEVRGNLQENYVPRNKRGDFWARVHDSIEVTADANEASILLTELGIGLRYYGGDVYPGVNNASSGPNKGNPTKALAVPSDNVPVVNGRQISPNFAGTLAFLFGKPGSESVGYLVEGEEKVITRGKNKGKKRIVPKKGGDLLYTLRSITRHKGDKKILPSEEVMVSAAANALRDHLDSFAG